VSRLQQSLLLIGSITVNVSNTGHMDADEVVLGFISAPAHARRPIKQLFEFVRIHIKAGETATGQSQAKGFDCRCLR
jgi:hypothetical protein